MAKLHFVNRLGEVDSVNVADKLFDTVRNGVVIRDHRPKPKPYANNNTKRRRNSRTVPKRQADDQPV